MVAPESHKLQDGRFNSSSRNQSTQGDFMSYTSRGTLIDTDKCVNNIGNRFQMIIIASMRARELAMKNKHSSLFAHLHTPVTALLEIQNGELTLGDIRRVK